ncbi:BPSS1780 family membrane protein [Ideonella sp. DXS29W]|uniref:BPSS1780 family membrane protein n=1 Tax=Ideonella lacteola TaxID=2984193 RepID=A0ABU9BN45_9BURK
MGLKLQEVPAGAGVRWITQAFGEFRRYPLGYVSLFIGFLIALVFTLLVPFIGGIVLLMSPPLLTLAFMLAAHASQHGERPSFDAILVPWRKRLPDTRRRLLALLFFYASLMAASAWVAEAFSGGGFDNLVEAYRKGETSPEQLEPLMSAAGVTTGLAWGAAMISLASLLFWFAPALVHWGHQGPAQSIFSSVLALWRARWAFLNYGLFWISGFVAFTLLTNVLSAALGSTLSALLAVPLQLAMTCTFYLSVYFSFRDCFGEP